MSFIVAYITHKDREHAVKVVEHLLERRLVACANIFPIESAYWWKGEVRNEREVVSLVKTRAENWEKLRDEVEGMHPYEVPCIMKLTACANEAYEDWINSETCEVIS